jgi:hypothetical protein
VQAWADVHETDVKSSPAIRAPCDDQRRPFQPCANGNSAAPVPSVPTAVHAVADVHDTAEKNAWSALGTSGVCWILQTRPFHRSTRG